MSTSSTSITAGEVMDRSAVLMNDPSKTDYNYTTLTPFLKMAMDELSEALADGQSSPSIVTSGIITLPIGGNALHPVDSLNTPHFPRDLAEIQEIGERVAGSTDNFSPLKRSEFVREFEPGSQLIWWSWEDEIIKFNPRGANTVRELQLKYVKNLNDENIAEQTIVGSINSRSFLAYKTAAYAAMFIGENPKRAEVLDAKAEAALERIESINNKGRQQMMTRHRPFRAAYKARGGF